MSLATKLKELRVRKKQSLQDVADAIGASKTHVWDLETGRSSNPSVDLLTKLATHFQVRIADLVGENPNAPTRTRSMSPCFANSSSFPTPTSRPSAC